MSRDFFIGVIAMGFLIAAAFFFRFWRESGDRLFAFFAIAFLLMAITRPLLVASEESGILPYALRLASYALILSAIVDKNLRRT